MKIKLFTNTVNWTELLLKNVSFVSRLIQNYLAHIMNLTSIRFLGDSALLTNY